jgi:hypothetical protein
MPARDFVPLDFVIPAPPDEDEYFLTPLTVEHNSGDLDAWSSSVDHIHATAGSAHPWPDEPMTLERNLADLQGHMDDFAARRGFTYSVQSTGDGAVLGCVYIYPSPDDEVDAQVRSWVRASRAELDDPLYRTVVQWLRAQWPFVTFEYAPRPSDSPPPD